MKTLIWKEWREQRPFFFLSIGIIILSRIIPVIIPKITFKNEVDYELYILIMNIILPVIFSLFLGSISFTNEFYRNTKEFLLSQPVSTAKIFWTKYFFGLFLLIILTLLTNIILFSSFQNLADIRIVSIVPQQLLTRIYLLFCFIIIYSSSCFSSLLLKNTLPAIICTPFLLLFGIFLIAPLCIFLFLISPTKFIFIFFIFFVSIAVFLIFSLVIWQKGIAKEVGCGKKVFITTIIILFVSFGCHSIANIITSRILNRTIQQAKAEGIKLTPEEVIPPPVPDEENAATVYQEAFNLIDKLKEKYRTEWKYMPYESTKKIEELTTQEKNNINKIMKDPDFVKFYTLIDKAVNMPYCRLDIKYEEGSAMLLPHLNKMRQCARLVAARTYILTENKKYNDALNSVKTGLKIGESLTDEPILISQLVRIAIDVIAKNSLNYLLNKEDISFSKDSYYDLISIIDKKNRKITRSLDGELVLFGRCLFEQDIPFGCTSRNIFSRQNTSFPGIYGSLFWCYLVQPLLKNDYAFYIQYFLELIDYSQKPYYLVKNKLDELDMKFHTNNFSHSKHILSSMLIPAITTIIEQQISYNSCLDTLKLSLALKIYKEKYGYYPETLSSLVPDIIPEIPIDPFTGNDYIYKKEGRGFIVYSVGSNEKDDGGISDSKKKLDDISFKVLN